MSDVIKPKKEEFKEVLKRLIEQGHKKRITNILKLLKNKNDDK